MKKYILLLFVIVGALTSCSNDDITISQATTFKINPSTVIAPFTWEWVPGDLESFDTNYQLRIRLLIYNAEGLLERDDTQYFSNYSIVMNTSVYLPEGSYTAVAITDIIGKSSGTVSEYWTLSDYRKLSETYIEDAGYIGGQNKIMGISKTNFVVNKGTQNDISINVQPTGALFFIWFKNIHTFSDVESYYLSSAKTAESCLFSADGSYSISSQNHDGSYDWYVEKVDVEDYQSSGVYNYHYVLPVSNLNLKFQADTSSEIGMDISGVMTINPKAGDEWMFVLDMKDDENMGGNPSYDYGLVNGSGGGKSLWVKESLKKSLNNSIRKNSPKLYLKDIKM